MPNRIQRPRAFLKNRKKMTFEKRVKKVIFKQAESKFRDVADTISGFVAATSSTLQSDLLSIAEGDTSSSRDGTKFIVKGLQLNYKISVPSTGEGSNMNVRIMVIHLPNNIGLGSDTLNAALANGTFDMTSQYPRETDRNYKILYDRTHNNLHGIDSGGLNSAIVRKYIKINKTAYYDGSLAADLQKGDLMVLGFTENTTASKIDIDLKSRIFFKDL